MAQGKARIVVVSALIGLLISLCAPQIQADSPITNNDLPFTDSFDLSCGTSGVGTYRPISSSDAGVQKVAKLAFQSWWSTNGNATCAPGSVIQNGTSVSSACSQVVAGTNYAVLVEGFAVCPANGTSDPNDLTGSNVTLATKVYQPLGTAAPQITLLKLVSFTEDDF